MKTMLKEFYVSMVKKNEENLVLPFDMKICVKLQERHRLNMVIMMNNDKIEQRSNAYMSTTLCNMQVVFLFLENG